MNPPDDQRLLRESEEKYRTLFEASTDAIFLATMDGAIRDANASACRMFGYARKEILSLRAWALAPPEEEAKMARIVGEELKTSGVWGIQMESAGLRKDGSIFPTEVSLRVMPVGGEPCALVYVRDITERKRGGEALRESEEQFRLLVQNQGEGIGIVDFEERFVFVNPAGEEIFGMPTGGLVGRRLEEFTDPEEYLALREETWKRKDGEKGSYEMSIRRADGEKRILQVTAVPWLDKEKKFSGTFSIFRDITEQKRAEHQLRKRIKELQAFYRLAEITEREGITLDNLYQELTNILQKSWQYPEIACARIVIGDGEFRTKNFRESAWIQSAPVKVNGSVVGRIEVHYLEERPEADEGPFLKEERLLLETIAERLGHITGRKRVEEALQESEQRFKAIFDHSNDGILLADTEKKRFIIGNKTICQMLDYSPDEIKDLGVMDIHPPEDLPYVIDQFEKQARKEVAIAKDLPVARKDGSIFSADVNAFPITLAGKTYLVGAFRDTTERKRIEDSLRQSEERFRILFEQAADIILLLEITPEGIPVIRDVNSAAFRLLGYERDEMIGQPVSLIEAAPDASKVVEERREEVLSASGRKIFESKHRCKDGTNREFECSVTEMQIGSKTFAISVERDITERKNLEAQLIQAQKMEAVGLLAGGIAHEFNNILGGILGYASLMRLKMEPDHPFWRYVETIEKSSQRAAVLTSQLLGFARKGKYDLRLLNLNLLAEDTLAIVRQTFDRAVTVEARLAESLPKVEGDTMQLQQVLMNLCINARDAMPKGGSLFLTTGTEQVAEGDERIPLESKPGWYVLLSVADTGCGMDEETQAQIFEPFFTTKEKGKGTGLGLAMVYGVVKNHGGFVTVRSEVGRGSVFTLHLPAAEKPSDRRPEALAAPERSRGAVPDQTILVVDDEEAIRFLARDILEGEGYRVLLAEDGAQALEVYREHQGEIGLVVLDLVMPKLGGGEVFLKMKEMDPGVHVLVSSGYSQEGKAQEILTGGALGFVQKPFHVRDLISQVRQGLDGGGIPNGK